MQDPARFARAREVERVERISSLRWDEIPANVRRVVIDLFTGARPLTAPSAVEFAVRSVVDGRMAQNSDWKIVPVPGAGNTFASTGRSRASRSPTVRSATKPPAALIVGALLSLVLVALFVRGGGL